MIEYSHVTVWLSCRARLELVETGGLSTRLVIHGDWIVYPTHTAHELSMPPAGNSFPAKVPGKRDRSEENTRAKVVPRAHRVPRL